MIWWKGGVRCGEGGATPPPLTLAAAATAAAWMSGGGPGILVGGNWPDDYLVQPIMAWSEAVDTGGVEGGGDELTEASSVLIWFTNRTSMLYTRSLNQIQYTYNRTYNTSFMRF